MPKQDKPTIADSASIARVAGLWAKGRRDAAIKAIIHTSDTRSAAELALEVYARLRDHHGVIAAEAFRRLVRRG